MAPSILVVAEVADGTLTRLSTELATLARALAEASGGTAMGLVVDASPDAAAAELATFLPRVVSVASAAAGAQTWAPLAAAEAARLADEGTTHVLLGATTDGRDVAGELIARLGWGLLANAGGVDLGWRRTRGRGQRARRQGDHAQRLHGTGGPRSPCAPMRRPPRRRPPPGPSSGANPPRRAPCRPSPSWTASPKPARRRRSRRHASSSSAGEASAAPRGSPW